jgi:hypothetical protein
VKNQILKVVGCSKKGEEKRYKIIKLTAFCEFLLGMRKEKCREICMNEKRECDDDGNEEVLIQV